MTDPVPTRGESNFNPGNINAGGGWNGELGLEIVPPGKHYTARFARFDTAEHGIRAIAKQLLSYQRKHGLRTVRAMINRWAPPSDNNNTDAYVGAVCNHLGIAPDDDINLSDPTEPDWLEGMVFGIIREENGRVLYSAETIAAACKSALT